MYRHLKAAGSWEWYDHGHNGTPRVCRIQLHCTDTLQLQVLGSGTITDTTAPLVFVEYNYIVPTPYSCRFLGMVRSRPKRHPSCCRIQLHCTDTLQLQVLGSGTITATTAPPRICRIQLHCTDTLQLQVHGSGMITVTTEPLMFVEYNYIVPTPYSACSW